MNQGPLYIAHPGLVHGLWLWALVALLLIALDQRGSGRLERLVAARLADRLVDRPAAWRRAARLALYTLAGFAMVAALMRPQWGERFIATPRAGAEIMIALDVSRSMLADDARPTRLERAKAEISDLLAYLANDQVGLIAFAGRASILSPLTPDKSFLRLALDGAGPHSVSRGGTRLAEPILRAVAGLGEPGPAQRALILITDGEDHDSFALDAAKKAAEAGIKIITIGFGDEAGSPIFVRDPRDGSRTQVRDAEGNPVISRLDGELLREIALVTDGAYVPAGTGVLDLASIYDAHIARLTRGQLDARGRSIRGETYQGFVAVALAALVLGASAMAGGGSRRPRASADRGRSKVARGAGRSAALLLCGALLAAVASTPPPVRAEDEEAFGSPVSIPADAGQTAPGADALPSSPDSEPAGAAREEDPRMRFNRANSTLAAGDPDLASTLYREARRDAVDDHALRYAASYNLGMAAVAVADTLVASKPKEALARLHEAADWFREAAAMRPDETDPRHNLDVTLRRALILADEIARKGERDLASALDGLIEAQRARVAESAALLEALARAVDPDVADALRPAFDAAATALREQMADAQSLAERAADEKALLDAKTEQARKPEDALRAAALDGVVAGIDAGVERMGQARRQLRGRSAERAYRRGAEALADLKRARDALRDPVEQIGVLIGEVAGVAQATAALGGAEGAAAGASEAVRIPAFLTPESVGAESASVEARIGELARRFTTAAERVEQGLAVDPNAPGANMSAPDVAEPTLAEELRAALAAAAPRIRAAHAAMGRATAGIVAKAFSPALEAERETLAALREAQELFFGLRELLAVTHELEAHIAAVASADDPESAARRDAAAMPLAAEQRRNCERAVRLEALLAAERESALQTLAAGEADAADPSADPARIEALEQRFARAGELLREAAAAMEEADAGFGGARAAGGTGRDRAGRPDWSQIAPAAARATAALDALRMLFSTLVEQLQRLEREQTDVADRTGDAIALAAAEAATPARGPGTRARVEALDGEQRKLEARAGTIADALVVESDRAAAAEQDEVAAGGAVPAAAGGAPDSKTLRRAADHVATAQLAMQEASGIFADVRVPLEPASAAQAAARDALRRALELLQPPPPESPENPPPDASREDGGSDGDAGGGEDQPQDEGAGGPPPAPESEIAEDESAGASEDPGAKPAEGLDPAQLLQGVRDREAERREANERKSRERRRSAPVEKDW